MESGCGDDLSCDANQWVTNKSELIKEKFGKSRFVFSIEDSKDIVISIDILRERECD